MKIVTHSNNKFINDNKIAFSGDVQLALILLTIDKISNCVALVSVRMKKILTKIICQNKCQSIILEMMLMLKRI